ncbi:hypothetical protein UlMin_016133 [Ulmus minor]
MVSEQGFMGRDLISNTIFVDPTSRGSSSFSFIVAVEVTYFKCGGVSLGVGMEHHVVDGASSLHFVNSWSDMARGFNLTIPPFLDRTFLLPKDPPRPIFDHIEYQPAPTMKYTKPQTTSDNIAVVMFKITK